MIKINHLVKRYGDYLAVDDLSLSMEPGNIYGLLGPNGAGKSTTMNIMTGYLGASKGEVIVNGFDIFKDAKQAKKDIGYLPEFPPLYPDMTVDEYLRFVSELKLIPKKERKDAVEDALKKASLIDVRTRMIRKLSKGYKQRVGFAQAILGNPEIIILDEPTVGLDPKQINEFRDLIRSLKKEHTVLISSHILSEISEICDHVFIISNGKLVLSDSVENISKDFQKNQILSLLVKGSLYDIREALEKIPDIEKIECKNGEMEGTVLVSVYALNNADVRDAVAMALRDANVLVYQMNEVEQSLEDVFLSLTNDSSVKKANQSQKKAEDDENVEDEDDDEDEITEDNEDEKADDKTAKKHKFLHHTKSKEDAE